jgi:CRISPR/Cas system-associated endonuclease Cas1
VYASGSRNPAHPVNAILNYTYAVLQSQVQIKAVADGYDPMLGICTMIEMARRPSCST